MASAASMTRTAPTTVTSGQTFTLTYTASGVSGTWGAIINDNVAGGCSFQAGTNYKDAMLSTSGTIKTISITAPTSGSCTFSGYYQFSQDTLPTTFQSLTVSVGTSSCTPNWQCTSWLTCNSGTQVRTCADSNVCNVNTGKPTESQACTINQTCTPDNSAASSTCSMNVFLNNCNQTIQGTKNCVVTPPGEFCLPVAQDYLFYLTKSTDCQTNTIALIIGGLLLVVLIGKLL